MKSPSVASNFIVPTLSPIVILASEGFNSILSADNLVLISNPPIEPEVAIRLPFSSIEAFGVVIDVAPTSPMI